MIQRVEAGRELAAGVIADLGATLSDQVQRGVTSIRMSASRVMQFDSKTLEALLEFDALARSRGLTFTLDEPSELLLTALRITGLVGRFDVRMDAEAGDAPAGVRADERPSEEPAMNVEAVRTAALPSRDEEHE